MHVASYDTHAHKMIKISEKILQGDPVIPVNQFEILLEGVPAYEKHQSLFKA